MTTSTAVIIGAMGGVGKDCAISLAKKGYRLIATVRGKAQKEELQQALNALDSDCSFHDIYCLDLCDSDSIESFWASQESSASPAVVIFCAGVTSNKTDNFSLRELEHVLQINAISTIYLASRYSTSMKAAGFGYIICIASRAGIVGFEDKGIYGASKAALIRYFDSLYSKCLRTNVRVTTICPAWINTRMARRGGSILPENEMLQTKDISSMIDWLIDLPTCVRIKEITVEHGSDISQT